MLRMALAFLMIAIIAGLFGFNLVAGLSYDIAKVLFFVFIVLAILAFLAWPFRRPL